MRKTLLAAIIAATCTPVLAMNAVAAPPSGGVPGASSMQSQNQAQVSKAKLQKFATTYQAVAAIRDKYMGKMKNAKNKKDAQKIADNAQQAMKDSIKKHGFTLDEYSNVVKAINNNPQLYKQFQAIVGGPGGG